MKFEIMMSILFELLNKKTVTAQSLAEKYQVSRRSIYRYLQSLEAAGVPIYTNRGIAGGYSIIDTYRLTSSFLTKKEFDQTVGALSGLIESVPNSTLSNALNKLKASYKNEYSNLNIKSGNLFIDGASWGDLKGYKSKLAIVQKAMENDFVLNIRYHDRNGIITDREIEPHVIVFKEGLCYVYAYCRLRQEFRFFKIGRIEYANVTDAKFVRKEVEINDLPLDFWNDDDSHSCDLIIEVSPQYVSDVEEWLGIENVKDKQGKKIAEAKVPFDDGLISKLMTFGSGIKVIAPKELKERIKETARQIINCYN